MSRSLPWWTGQLRGARYYRKHLNDVSQEELDTLRAVARTFILLFLLWLVVEVVLGVLVTSYVPRIKSWIPLANLVLTPVVAVCSVILARWIVVFRYPERTAVADAKAAARLGSGRIS
jgi:hypothetical protein